MSKIAIVLCVALFATAPDSAFAGVFNDTSDVVAGRVVNNVISNIELHIRQAHERAEAELKKVFSGAFKKADDFGEKIIDIVAKSHDEVVKVFRSYQLSPQMEKKMEGAFTECMQISRPLWEVGGPQSRAMSKANECIVEELKEGYFRTNDFGDLYARALENITSIKAEVEKCSEIEDRYGSLKNFLAVQYCPEKVAAKAYEISVAVIPALNTKVTLLSEWWIAIYSKFEACTSVTHLSELHKETGAMVKATKECIEAKIKLAEISQEMGSKS